jgi:hypothetical protein
VIQKPMDLLPTLMDELTLSTLSILTGEEHMSRKDAGDVSFSVWNRLCGLALWLFIFQFLWLIQTECFSLYSPVTILNKCNELRIKSMIVGVFPGLSDYP